MVIYNYIRRHSSLFPGCIDRFSHLDVRLHCRSQVWVHVHAKWLDQTHCFVHPLDQRVDVSVELLCLQWETLRENDCKKRHRFDLSTKWLSRTWTRLRGKSFQVERDCGTFEFAHGWNEWPIPSSFCSLTKNITSHSMKNLAFHRLFRRSMIIYYQFSLMQVSLKGWDNVLFNPFTPKSDQLQISPAPSPELLHHTLWRTWRFIVYSEDRWLYYQFSLHHLYIYFSLKRLGERTFWTREWKGSFVTKATSEYSNASVFPVSLLPWFRVDSLITRHLPRLRLTTQRQMKLSK